MDKKRRLRLGFVLNMEIENFVVRSSEENFVDNNNLEDE